MIQSFASRGRSFDGTLNSVVRNAAVSQEAAFGSPGAFEMRPVPLSDIRKDLFGMLAGAGQQANLARACLQAIDELRDEYGMPEFEPRHPDILSGRAWPLEVDETSSFKAAV